MSQDHLLKEALAMKVLRLTWIIVYVCLGMMFGPSARCMAFEPLLGAKQVSAGFDHSCVVTANGGAMCWGDNSSGELGNGTAIISGVPIPVPGLSSGVAAIVAGGALFYGGDPKFYTCAIVNNGAECWGSNDYGELGNGTTTDSDVPVVVAGLNAGVTAITAGDFHTCAIVNGGAWCWGNAGNGELGNGMTTNSSVPVAVTGLSSGVTAISAGSGFTCAVVNGGTRCVGGYNNEGELGNGTASVVTNSKRAVSRNWIEYRRHGDFRG